MSDLIEHEATNYLGLESRSKSTNEYIVKQDDTLPKIALKFGTSIGELSLLNYLSSQLLYPTQVLYIPKKQPREESNTTLPDSGLSCSPLIPTFRKPIKAFKRLKPDKDYDLTILSTCMRIDASILSFINIHEKKFVELILNPTSITVKLHSASDYERNPHFYGNSYNCQKYDDKYTISFQAIKSFSFFSTAMGLLSDDPTDYSCDPINSKIEMSSSRKTEHHKPEVAESLPADFLFSEPTFNTNSISFSEPSKEKSYLSPQIHRNIVNDIIGTPPDSPTTQKYLFNKCHTPLIFDSMATKPSHVEESQLKKHSMKGFCSYYRFKRPFVKGKNFFRHIKNSLKGRESNDVLSHVGYWDSSFNQLPPKSHCKCFDSSHIYVSMRIKGEITKDSVSIFRDFEHLYDPQDPKLFFEISTNHLEAFRDFIDKHLPRSSYLPLETPSSHPNRHSSSLDLAPTFLGNEILLSVCHNSLILYPKLLFQLSDYFPSRALMQPMSLGYSTQVHGTSMRTLYRNMLKYQDTPSLLVIMDEGDCVFGAILSCLPKVSLCFYGNGECVLFKRVTHEIMYFYPWSHKNTCFIKGDTEYLAVGAGAEGYGLWINEDLIHGNSYRCETFDSDVLSDIHDFKCKLLEVWVFQ